MKLNFMLIENMFCLHAINCMFKQHVFVNMKLFCVHINNFMFSHNDFVNMKSCFHVNMTLELFLNFM
jgi:hypothetical protein